MLQQYSVRGQVRTLLVEYNRLGTFYRRAREEYYMIFFMCEALYDYIGRPRWGSGEWKDDAAFARISADIIRFAKRCEELDEELESIEMDAYTCYCSMFELIDELGERCEGSALDLFRGQAQGFDFEY